MATATATTPRLSWSQVRTYQQCPAKWYFSRTAKPAFTPSALKFGAAMHSAVGAYYAALQDNEHLPLDELLETYDAAWARPRDADVRLNEGETDGGLRAMAGRMLTTFLKEARPGEVLTVEQPFAVELGDGLLVSGVVDLLEHKDGRLWIVDHKTSRNAPSAAVDAEQVALYLLGLRALGTVPDDADVGLRYDVLRKLKTRGEFVQVEVTVTEHELDELVGKFGQVWRAIENGIVYRVRSWACKTCPWREPCATAVL